MEKGLKKRMEKRRDARGMEDKNAPPSAAAAALRLQGYTTIQESGKNNDRMNDRSERYGGRRPRRRPASSPTLLAHLETSFLLPMQRSNTKGQEKHTHKRAKKNLSGVLRREREGEWDERPAVDGPRTVSPLSDWAVLVLLELAVNAGSLWLGQTGHDGQGRTSSGLRAWRAGWGRGRTSQAIGQRRGKDSGNGAGGAPRGRFGQDRNQPAYRAATGKDSENGADGQ
ncbi:unnamed protein product [Calypogeia fissa]